MAIRYLKIVLLICVSLLGLLFAIQNLANLEQAYASLAYVMSNQDHVAYPNSAFPAITSPLLIWAALGAVLTGEFGAGFLAAKGSWDLFAHRKASAEAFNAAKTFGVLGCGVAVITWFGLFMVIGGAYFQMWQTAIGTGSWSGSFYVAGASALVMIFLNMED